MDMALHPARTLSTVATNSKELFAGFTRRDLQWIARTSEPYTTTKRVDFLNASYLVVMALGLLGLLDAVAAPLQADLHSLAQVLDGRLIDLTRL